MQRRRRKSGHTGCGKTLPEIEGQTGVSSVHGIANDERKRECKYACKQDDAYVTEGRVAIMSIVGAARTQICGCLHEAAFTPAHSRVFGLTTPCMHSQHEG